MDTIRKKISVGFLALSLVLFCAVIINVFELNRMSQGAKKVVAKSAESTEFATRMLDALQKQNRAVLNMVILNDDSIDDEYHSGIYELSAAILEAMEANPDSPSLNHIYETNRIYHQITEENFHNIASGEVDNAWFLESYVEAYYELDSAIKSYMASPKSSVAVRMSNLESDVYKTITPSVLTLLVAVTILIMFHFFIDTYYTKPLRNISRGLDGYIKAKVPYQVKIEEKSELSSLNDNIKELIGLSKKQ